METNAKTKNDKAWEQLFCQYNILKSIKDNGSYIISSSNINQYREARLMTKFDHRFQLPYLFAEAGLSLLPVNRGEYIISEIETFADFADSSQLVINELDAPRQWQSLDYENITSEAIVINCAYVGGLLADFLGEEELYPTVNGRMASSDFSFSIAKKNTSKLLNVSVSNSQIEIDGGYEGHNSFSLIEAKNVIAPDFLIRQLYYPYRLWSQKINKPVRCIFLTYTNGVYHFREYRFLDSNLYNSIQLVQEKKYRFREKLPVELNIGFLQDCINSLPTVAEPPIPFPQADSFERVINLCEVIMASQGAGVTKDGLLSDFYFTDQESLAPRQVDYYVNAARYLGFVDKITKDGVITYILTSSGTNLFRLSIGQRQIEFVKSILAHQVFKKVMSNYLSTFSVLSKNTVVSYMKESNLYEIKSDITFGRRAGTVISWIYWILRQIDEQATSKNC